MFHPAALRHQWSAVQSGFEVELAGDGSVSVRGTEQGNDPISEACIVEALAGYERRGKLSLVVFRQRARSYRDPDDGHWDSVWQAKKALDRGADELRDAERLRAELEALRDETTDDELWKRHRVLRGEQELCRTQAAALAFFRVAKELDRRPELEVYLGQAHERLGDFRRAAQAYTRYVEGRSDAPDVDEFRRRAARLESQSDDRYAPRFYGPTRASDLTSVSGACDWVERGA